MLIKVNANQNRRAEMKQSAEILEANMTSKNVDLQKIGKYAFASKEVDICGKKFQVMIHTSKSVLSKLETITPYELGAVFQIWNGSSGDKSVVLPLSKDQLEDARKNYRGRDIIDADDVVTQAVSALRLCSDSIVVQQLAMHCAYDNDGVDGDACARVWD